MSSLYGDDIFTEVGKIHKKVSKGLANPISVKGQVYTAIKSIKAKLSSLDSAEEKRAYLNKLRTNTKRGMTDRQNKLKTQMAKNAVAKEYQKIFDLIDSELEKLS